MDVEMGWPPLLYSGHVAYLIPLQSGVEFHFHTSKVVIVVMQTLVLCFVQSSELPTGHKKSEPYAGYFLNVKHGRKIK